MILNENGINHNESEKINIDWMYVHPLKSPSLIEEFEKQFNFNFPNEYKECVLKYNDGFPSNKYKFDTEKTREHVFKTLLSFNKKDEETIWNFNNINDEYLRNTYIAFAIDFYENKIAFNKDDNSIHLIYHETNDISYVADSFSSFINSLY